MTRALIGLFFLVSFWGKAQVIGNVDFDSIKESISQKSSEFYYPHLVERVLNLDTNLTATEFKYLYYGNVFQDYYYPYGATVKQKKFEDTYKNATQFKEIEAEGLAVFQENPVNLDVILKMIFLYNHEKEVEKATVFAKIYVSFLEVIYASGTGMDCESGFVVISVDDEYRITGDLGLTVVQQDLIGACDRLTFAKKGQKRKNRIKGLYFNVRMPLTYLSKSFNQSDLPAPDSEPDEDED